MNIKNNTIDFTRGSITKELFVFSIPLFIGSVFSLLYSMVDSMVLGKFVSVNALAAVGATQMVTMLIIHLTNALTNTVSVQMSQAVGAKRYKEVKRILGNSIILTMLVGLLVMAIVFIGAPRALVILRTPEEILPDAALYLRITGGLFFGQLFYTMLTSILRGIGDSTTPLYFLIFSSFLNIVLDILFVVVFHWDVAGVAWATVISQAASAGLCIVYTVRKHPELRFALPDMKFSRTFLKEHFRISLPMAFQGGMLAVGDLTMSAVINSFGTDAVAAFTIGWKCVQLVQITYSQITFSMSVFTGQNYGARQYKRIREGIRKALKLIVSLSVLSGILLLCLKEPLMNIFLLSSETTGSVRSLIREYMNVTAFFLPALALILTFLATLRGMGHVTPTVVSSFVELACKIGFSLLLPIWFRTKGLWFAMPMGWVLGLIPPAWFYYSGVWEKKALERDSLPDPAIEA